MKIQGKTATEIFESVRGLAQGQYLPAGTVLPPVRDLAAELGVNRNTVAAAYRRLVTAGIAIAQGRLGTRIRAVQQLVEQEGAVQDTPLYDLASGNPHVHCLPDMYQALRTLHHAPRLYGEPTLNPGLAAYLQNWFAPDCPQGFALNLTHGAVDAIERVLSAYLLAGDKVAVEDPCFLSSINTLHISGYEALGVAMDEQGMQVDSLREALDKGAQAIILTPRAHNPTGVSLSRARADALAALLAQYPHVVVIIDDHFALLARAPYYSVLQACTTRWVLIRSLSKALGPDIRVAALASDTDTSQHIRLRLASGTNWISHILQDVVEALLQQEQTTALLQQARDHYQAQRERLAQALTQRGIDFYANGDGLNMWIPLKHDDQAVVLELAKKGWLVRQGSTFSIGRVRSGLRITISDLQAQQSDDFARDLQQSLSRLGAS